MTLFSLIHRVVGFCRRRPLPSVTIMHGSYLSTVVLLTASLRTLTTIIMCGWYEPYLKRMITDLMNRRVIFTPRLNVAAGLPRENEASGRLYIVLMNFVAAGLSRVNEAT